MKTRVSTIIIVMCVTIFQYSCIDDGSGSAKMTANVRALLFNNHDPQLSQDEIAIFLPRTNGFSPDSISVLRSTMEQFSPDKPKTVQLYPNELQEGRGLLEVNNQQLVSNMSTWLRGFTVPTELQSRTTYTQDDIDAFCANQRDKSVIILARSLDDSAHYGKFGTIVQSVPELNGLVDSLIGLSKVNDFVFLIYPPGIPKKEVVQESELNSESQSTAASPLPSGSESTSGSPSPSVPKVARFYANVSCEDYSNKVTWSRPPGGVEIDHYIIDIQEINNDARALNQSIKVNGQVTEASFTAKKGLYASFKYRIGLRAFADRDGKVEVNVFRNVVEPVQITCN
jgi:hypothetical protein